MRSRTAFRAALHRGRLAMFRPLMIAMSLAAGASAADAGGPEIAYVKAAGSNQELYLVNPDGSALTKLYTGPRKTSLSWLDLKPGGNEIAFMEGLRVKVQKFHDNGQANGTASGIPGPPCSITQSPDYHPSGDGTLVFIAACGFGNFQVMTYKSGDAGPAALFTVSASNRIRWSRTGDYLYYDEAVSPTSAEMRLKRRNVATGAVTDFGAIRDLNTFDVTRTGDRLAFGSTLAPKLLDFATMSDVSQATALCEGTDIHFSPADTQIVYVTPHSAKGDYILIKASNCSGSPFSLTGKGSWGTKDWRPNPHIAE